MDTIPQNAKRFLCYPPAIMLDKTLFSYAKTAYGVLLNCCFNGKSVISEETLASHMACDVKTARKALKALVTHGYIVRLSGKRTKGQFKLIETTSPAFGKSVEDIEERGNVVPTSKPGKRAKSKPEPGQRRNVVPVKVGTSYLHTRTIYTNNKSINSSSNNNSIIDSSSSIIDIDNKVDSVSDNFSEVVAECDRFQTKVPPEILTTLRAEEYVKSESGSSADFFDSVPTPVAQVADERPFQNVKPVRIKHFSTHQSKTLSQLSKEAKESFLTYGQVLELDEQCGDMPLYQLSAQQLLTLGAFITSGNHGSGYSGKVFDAEAAKKDGPVLAEDIARMLCDRYGCYNDFTIDDFWETCRSHTKSFKEPVKRLTVDGELYADVLC